ncbi:chromosome segregation protein SMC [Salinarimonas ramus]|uniref:Chromosome partition protein Smc n=1 Tax=Salinarimonas ramus TaxID=690164 RepID=A0A917QA59_9HYPH|nr:chromosome segregation protein SMC [Salinarimonas ramus]GGK39302.1 chromosome partition protein Smc [Salinarimonas ramus]
MQLTRLRIAGFKTFVEATDVPIEPGLTGIVGPNGCGKSNLVEALRWVMGESSYKAMRASGMDDVIFNGSGNRPARNAAEVTVSVDNTGRTAPAAFNDADQLEISRKIAREAGSTYRINGREVRARDVQLLFADAATGARSAALVRQGQISEIIAAKPQARRRILEDAAGIAGLHARRHEAELRLKAAEENLSRVEDVLSGLDGQIEGLRRQSRQAARYRAVAAEIRRLEAMVQLIGHAAARADAAAAASEAQARASEVADKAQAQARTAREQAIAAHALPGLREGEAAAAAALQRLVLARAELDGEETRTKDKLAALERRAGELVRDRARQEALSADAIESIGRLEAEHAALADTGRAAEEEEAAREALSLAESVLAEAEAAMAALQTRVSDLNARRGALERTAAEEEARIARFSGEAERLARERAALEEELPADLDELVAAREAAAEALEEADTRAADARALLDRAREAESRARGPLAEAERAAQKLDTEAATLRKLFAPVAGARYPAMLDQVRVEKGYETALAAALGEDLDASSDPAAPAHWVAVAADADPALPSDAVPLARVVEAPAALGRRLAQVGVVSRADGARLADTLAPGQRLVSREGDLWRWDGYRALAEAPSAAARRLAERNRLADLEEEAQRARDIAEERRRDLDRVQTAARNAAALEARTLEEARGARRALDAAREAAAAAERRAADVAAKRASLADAAERVAESLEEARERAEDARAALDDLAPAPELEIELAQARARVGETRADASERRGALQSLVREAERAQERRRSLEAEIMSWRERGARARESVEEIAERLEATREELEILREAPDDFALRRRRLLAEIEGAEAARREAADRLAEGERVSAESDRAARAALDALSAVREAAAGAEARREAQETRLLAFVQAIRDAFDTDVAGLHALALIEPGDALPDQMETEAKLLSLKGDRERLGAVNLRAEDELAELEGKKGSLAAERDDLVEAIRRLRGAVASLNKEGRERLLAAFTLVNGHFESLFTTLFGGGTAQLTLVDSDDPLEAGLEILARPPGKKPQTMTLLSGGEQALTATALIFAVFLTNPSPICVLDEVDAPLDDANVERYCDLLDEMAGSTRTRFLVITHNPITMARMDRLFGVTMAERGVSTLVSVDLERAERLAEAV